MTHILVGTPCYNGLVNTEYMVSMLGLQSEMNRQGVGFSLEMTTTMSLVPVARNFIVAKVLQARDATHLLFIDADLAFNPTDVTRYLRADKDVVAGIYPVKNLDLNAIRQLPADKSTAATLNYAVRICDGAQPTSDGFVQAEYAATGFMLIKRHVLEQMAARHPELKYNHSFTHVSSPQPTDNSYFYALFDTSIDREQGLYLPEDYTFCKRWRAMGGEIWVDVLSKFTHIGTYLYQGDFSVFVNRA
jgi:hypothetical protein